MAGRLDETSYAVLKERKLSDQAEILDYTGDETTFVAVVSEPRGHMLEVVDEWWPELGMPEWALKRFLERRAGYRTNSAVEDAHNKAYEDTHLSGIYQKHLNENEEARQRLHEAVERLVSGEDITLVCYEQDGEKCHRHILMDVIQGRVESRQNCKFKLRA